MNANSVAACGADSAKVVALLAMAAGTAAFPQTCHSSVIVTDLAADPGRVGFSAGFNNALLLDLPGTAQFGFQTNVLGIPYSTVRRVSVGRQTSDWAAGAQANSLGHVEIQALGADWNIHLPIFFNAIIGEVADDSSLNPQLGFDHQYFGFVFQDTAAGGGIRYGWAEIGLSIGLDLGPDMTLYRYAYEDSGQSISMGAVPEPAAPGLLVMGALLWGAKGIRAWRSETRVPPNDTNPNGWGLNHKVTKSQRPGDET